MRELKEAIEKVESSKHFYLSDLRYLNTIFCSKKNEIRDCLAKKDFEGKNYWDLVPEAYNITYLSNDKAIFYCPQVTLFDEPLYINSRTGLVDLLDNEGNLCFADTDRSWQTFKKEWFYKTAEEIASEIFSDLIEKVKLERLKKSIAEAKEKESRHEFYLELKEEFEGGKHE